MIIPETREEIVRLFEGNLSKKAIARRLGIDVKTVRRVLGISDAPAKSTEKKPVSKLAPHVAVIAGKVQEGLTGSRILREIREQGYSGSRTILMDHIRKIRGAAHAKRRSFRRFETAPAQEAQLDWSPYRVIIAGHKQLVHCFSLILCHSRYMFVEFHRDERLATLLGAHVAAFEFFKGIPKRIVYDNMATVTLGRRGRDILWHPEFIKFAQHYLFEPYLCRPYDPNRKGKVERPFQYIESDFLLAREFTSWEDLDRSCQKWLKEIANRRVHSTTRQVPQEVFLAERELLIALPDSPYPYYRQEIRTVYEDGTISLDGTRYSVPCQNFSPKSTVSVRVHAHHIELLDEKGHIVATHHKPDMPGKLVIVPEHYQDIGKTTCQTGEHIEESFLVRFPDAQDFVTGVRKRMKSLYRLHLLEILKLVQLYGDEATSQAVSHATRFANFNAHAVARILRQRFPLVGEDCRNSAGFSGDPKGWHIEDVESGSFEEYRGYSRGDIAQNRKEQL